MSGNTGLLTDRCDPYGIESTVKLMGGVYPESMMGRYIWYCAERAVSRHVFVCTGGEYGFRRAPGGIVASATHCPGGHKGPPMPLCPVHIREMSVGPPRPGFVGKDMTPVGQVGGTKANELCPKCAMPDEARELSGKANELQDKMSRVQYAMLGSGLLVGNVRTRDGKVHNLAAEFARLQAAQDQVRGRLDELHERGVIHKCPLKLIEVS